MTELVRILSYVRVSGMSEITACNQSGYGIAYMSACIHYTNEMPAAMSVFSQSSNMTIVRRLSYVRVNGK